jgi:alpha-glucosidase
MRRAAAVRRRPSTWAFAVIVVLALITTTPPGFAYAPPSGEAARANAWTVQSPSGDLTVALHRDPADGRLSLTVARGPDAVLTSRLGLQTEAADLTRDLEFLGLQREEVREDYATVVGKRHSHRDVANQLTASFATPAGDRIDVQVRAFDDGVGYRYLVPGSGDVTVTGERSDFRLPPAADAWLMELRANYENQYEHRGVGDVEPLPYAFPALFRLPGGTWTLVTEADVDGRYAAAHLMPSGGGRFRVTLPESVGTAQPLATPWRVAMVGDLASVVESDLVTDLAPDSRVADTEWIRPGTVAWSWWSDGASPRSFERQKDYVDHAAEEGWDYVLVDEGWSPEWMPELVSYARSKGVDVLVWARWDDLETQQERDTLLPRWKGWGVAGVKLDFMNSDSQARMRWYDDVLRDTAQQHLMVNFHGSTVPRGLERTWPHVMTTEGVRGAEDYHLGWVTPKHNVNLALTRNVVGSMDYTPITFSAERRETSAGHELALSVVYESGWLHPADSAESYDSRGVAEAVLRVMPTTWDQSELIAGSPDSAAAFARRSGDRWFVGSIHAGPAGTTRVPMDFLGEDQSYVADIVRDRGHDDLVVDRRTVTDGDTLTVDTAANGGFVILLCPATEAPCLDDGLLSTVTMQPDRRWPDAGDSDMVTVRVENKGSETLRDVQAELSPPEGWSAESTGGDGPVGALPPGQTATYTWRVSIPADAAAGSRHELRSDVRYAAGAETIERTAVRSVVIAPNEPPSGSPYLSDVPIYDSFNWVGPLERDQSNGGSSEGDGTPLTIEGRTFSKGLGGFAHSEQVIYIGGGCDRLTGYVGVDDAVGERGSVAFHVWGDDRLLYDSGPMTGADPARRMDIPVDGVEALRLVLVDGGDFVDSDMGDWADARLAC